MSNQIINLTMSTPKVSIPTEKAIDVTEYKDSVGSGVSGDVYSFYIKKPGCGDYIIRTAMDCGIAWFLWVGTCIEGVPDVPSNQEDVSIKLYDSDQKEVAIDSQYDVENYGWIIEPQSESLNGYWVNYTVSDAQVGTEYQYPSLTDGGDWWDSSNLITLGSYICCTSTSIANSLWQAVYSGIEWNGTSWTALTGKVDLEVKSGTSWAVGLRPSAVRVTYSSTKPDYGGGASWWDELSLDDTYVNSIAFARVEEGSLSGIETTINFASNDLNLLTVNVYYGNDRLPASRVRITNIEFKIDGVWKPYLY